MTLGLRIYRRPAVGCQIPCHPPEPAMTRVVSRDVIEHLSQTRVISSERRRATVTAGWIGLPLMGLQRACPQIRTALEDRRVDGLVLGLDPVPESPLADLSSQLIFSPEPLLRTSDPVGVDFVEQIVVSRDFSVLPDIPEAGE